jgi:prevent-host-death family protein
MATRISKSELKPHALRYFRQVERTRQEIIVTDRGRPVLKIVPYSEDPRTALQQLRGSVVKYDDPLKPVGQFLLGPDDLAGASRSTARRYGR